jgi:peptidoglycan hydrolase-like protein with peptidoglycan-binding domain
MTARRRTTLSLALLLPIVLVASAGARVGPRLSRAEIRQAEQRLAALGFWTGPVDGVWDGASRQALIAFQKLQGTRRTGVLTRADLEALSVATPLRPREPEPGPRIEVDIGRQVLYRVDADGDVRDIVPISSGSGKTFHENGYPETRAITPCGHLQVYAKASGWKRSPLGEMHNPLYIVGGVAIHGSTEMRTYPASHGCIRIPMFASEQLPKVVPKGTPVFVFGCSQDASPLMEASALHAAAGSGPR